jgi:hypothetical protein
VDFIFQAKSSGPASHELYYPGTPAYRAQPPEEKAPNAAQYYWREQADRKIEHGV